MIGNSKQWDLIREYITRVSEQGVSHPFLIVSGPTHIGKYTALLEHARRLTHPYWSDLLVLEDLSDEVGKEHTLKIERPKTKDKLMIRRANGTMYEDLWVREAVERLSLSANGSIKVLLIEHLERMNASSANALLKTLEEPNGKQLILATSSQSQRLLPTILSRALVIKMDIVSDFELSEWLMSQYPQLSRADIDRLVVYAQWRPGLAITGSGQLEQLGTLIDQAQLFSTLMLQQWWYPAFIQLSKKLAQAWSVESIVDMLLIQYQQAWGNHQLADRLSWIKRAMRTNVNVEHLLLAAKIWWNLSY